MDEGEIGAVAVQYTRNWGDGSEGSRLSQLRTSSQSRSTWSQTSVRSPLTSGGGYSEMLQPGPATLKPPGTGGCPGSCQLLICQPQTQGCLLLPVHIICIRLTPN
ncbi:hypothetical protein DPEC_G00317360 [Dallia pectoralis]|uniref:Uncharacterized protein n=1 Tax=Dallia pectoralis TaxID=75939 RepID=A0ACC2FD18_DALPE|nr:hypothetical protein DPEC_G00317360 [Dallia pectoralis]